MVRLSRTVPMLVVAAAVLTTAACRPKPEATQTPTPTVNQDSINAANAARARQDSIDAANRRLADEAAARERARTDSINAAASRLAEARNALTAMVYFDYDQSEITDQSRASLDAKIPLLNANAGLRIRVTGHTDSRGSDEYNVALGKRRAETVKRYLVSRGIASGRIETDTRGEESPVAQGEDESAWSQNRRAEFEILAGGDNLVLPNS